MKDWYQVQEEGMNVIHRGKTAKPGELVYLTKEQAKLHDKAIAIADKPPGKIAEVTAASDFNEWKEEEKKSKVKSQKSKVNTDTTQKSKVSSDNVQK